MTDGIGTTIYEYGEIGNLGANKVASVISPVAGQSELTDIITYQYDELGREIGRNADGFIEETLELDDIGRQAMVNNSFRSIHLQLH